MCAYNNRAKQSWNLDHHHHHPPLLSTWIKSDFYRVTESKMAMKNINKFKQVKNLPRDEDFFCWQE